MDSEKDVVEFNGITFIRYPNAKTKSARRYYYPYVGGKRAKGVGLLHQEVWKAAHGPIPPGHDIHHRDGNPLNNDLANLECLTKAEHSARHAAEFHDARVEHADRIRPMAAEWHRSEEGRAWHREHGKRTWEGRHSVQLDCIECGKTYEARGPRGDSRFCSRRCLSRYHERNRTYYEDRTCPICGSTFNVKRSKQQQTCSRACGWEVRRRKRAGLQP